MPLPPDVILHRTWVDLFSKLEEENNFTIFRNRVFKALAELAESQVVGTEVDAKESLKYVKFVRAAGVLGAGAKLSNPLMWLDRFSEILRGQNVEKFIFLQSSPVKDINLLAKRLHLCSNIAVKRDAP